MNNFINQIGVTALLIILLGSCSDMGAPEVFLPQLEVSQDNIDFSTITIGSTQTREIRIINAGDGTLQGELTLMQDGLSFSLHPKGSFALAANDTLVTELNFNPSADVNYFAIIMLSSDDPVNPEITIDVSGRGTLQLLPVLTLSDTRIDFGTIRSDSTAQQELNISNTGTDTLVISSLTIDLSVYLSDAALPLILSPGESQMVILTFEPGAAGSFNAEMTILSNSSESPHQLTLIGIAEDLVSYGVSVQPIWNASCIGCHGSSGGLNLSSFSQLMVGNSNNGPVVLAGNGSNSPLIQKLRGTSGSQMPLNQTPLATASIDLIETWIDQGALNN